ncbi:MAG: carbamoyl-phosphate synthase (glutamine-hydrolyzing) large subunit [Candidatus Verstraetearchaeota archaeon]|nr:carbamoyl-phosphate synthase (glutamine-hydrolyzing) large subunit [Candidatus Verstraetearchaeota archaeon]
MPKFPWLKKVLILGSGAIKIGEAAEFDYSGSQCIKALREEGIETVLVNPNIATIQTDPRLAGKVYLLPVTPKYVEMVIERERPDGILLGFGGQTALNCGVQLARRGILDKYGVKVLGTSIDSIETTGDRERFKQTMVNAGINVPRSGSANSISKAIELAKEIGYPVIVRVAYTLGGKGSGVAYDEKDLVEIAERGLAQSMIKQILVEEYLNHWKEVEYEVVRDYEDNCITVCNMENLDPLGVHTGDSIVVAPSQTLTNYEYHMLRSASIRAIRALGIIGECNIQWALDPKSNDFRVIEVNSRLSRSSALASKATGYPLAYVAAKLAIGYSLTELTNRVTGVTTACFEPALDYVIVKYPRWDFQKFRNVDPHLGPQMKSVGEVMAIGRCFEEALQKAIRMLDIGKRGAVCNPDEPEGDLEAELARPTDKRLFYVVKALRTGMPVERVYELSGIDPWFLKKIKRMIDIETELRGARLEEGAVELVREAKRLGFSDLQIAVCTGASEDEVREFRRCHGIVPVVKQIDTMAAEWPARTNYLYVTYGGDEDDIDFGRRRKAMVLGAGVFRIGTSVEFDWCGVNTAWGLKKEGFEETIIVNNNPETVSTDYDVPDKLYFEELTFERIMDIEEKERVEGVVLSVGGQIPNNLAVRLSNAGMRILGSSAESIDLAEDRSKFSDLLVRLGIPQPRWKALTSMEEAKAFAKEIGFPVIVRPSYVLSGAGMRVVYNEEALDGLRSAIALSKEHPMVMSKFLQSAREVDVDGVADGEEVYIGAVLEHLESAGIHSGDAIMCIPPRTLSEEVVRKVRDYTERIARGLGIRGPFNVQYIVKEEEVYVIECNLRASRTFPFVSKTIGVNLMDIACAVMAGKRIRDLGLSPPGELPHSGVKVPVFSFMRLTGADTLLGVEMLSTGEVACIGENFTDALMKSLEAAEIRIPDAGSSVLVTVGNGGKKTVIIPFIWVLKKEGFKIYATEKTSRALEEAKLKDIVTLHKIREVDKKPNISEEIASGNIDLVINIPVEESKEEMEDEYLIRRMAVEFNVPVMTTLELVSALVGVIKYRHANPLTIKSLNEYMDALPWRSW